jgi:5-formyltetrahydrofolate cyclo-ligase
VNEDVKQQIRDRVWRALEEKKVARWPGARGRIPNFVGAEAAAERLASMDEWERARWIKANPDAPQLAVRARALQEHKTVYMAVPRLTERRPFIELKPDRLTTTPRKAASIKGAFAQGTPVAVDGIPHIDLVVCGSVAVSRTGARIGKGGGYSDLEFGLLAETGLVDDHTVLVTTVHPLQVLDDDLPETEHDFRVDRIVTADEVIVCAEPKRPRGILWAHLDAAKIDSIPVLARRAERRLREC